MTNAIARVGDMGHGTKLKLVKDSDGDISVSVIPENHLVGEHRIEFCNSRGKSHYTMKALSNLFKAMEKDAKERPEGNPSRI